MKPPAKGRNCPRNTLKKREMKIQDENLILKDESYAIVEYEHLRVLPRVSWAVDVWLLSN
jgi:hypothetical protein